MRLGFHQTFIQKIDQCISILVFIFFVLVNGETEEFFNGRRDLLLPYLFIEILSKILHKAGLLDLINGIKLSRNNELISHFLFMNDLTIMLKATRNNVINCNKILETLCKVSGQEISCTKLEVFSRNLLEDQQGGLLKKF